MRETAAKCFRIPIRLTLTSLLVLGIVLTCPDPGAGQDYSQYAEDELGGVPAPGEQLNPNDPEGDLLDELTGTSGESPSPLPVPPQPTQSRPLTVENQTGQRVTIWIYHPGNLAQPFASYWLDPGRYMELTNNNQRLPVTPEWGFAAALVDQSLVWNPAQIKTLGYAVDQNGHYRIILVEPQPTYVPNPSNVPNPAGHPPVQQSCPPGTVWLPNQGICAPIPPG